MRPTVKKRSGGSSGFRFRVEGFEVYRVYTRIPGTQVRLRV